MKYDVFLSYSPADKAFADAIRTGFAAEGITCTDVSALTANLSLKDLIDACKALVLIVSNGAAEDDSSIIMQVETAVKQKKEIISSELEQEALRLHKQWGDEADFWRYEYNYQSSTARAIHLKARSNLSGQAANRSGITEHKRWNAYMRSLGYTYSGSGDPSSRNDLAKLHNDLIPYDQLSASEKLKDEDP